MCGQCSVKKCFQYVCCRMPDSYFGHSLKGLCVKMTLWRSVSTADYTFVAGCWVAHFGHSLKGLCVEMGSLAFGLFLKV